MPVMAPTGDDSSSSDTDGAGVDSEDLPGEDTPPAVTYEHLGCFKDSKEDRVLTRIKLGSPEMTADVSVTCFSLSLYMLLLW